MYYVTQEKKKNTKYTLVTITNLNISFGRHVFKLGTDQRQ